MKLVENFFSLVPILQPYPYWVKVALSAWVLLTALGVVGLLFFRIPQSETHPIEPTMAAPSPANEKSVRTAHLEATTALPAPSSQPPVITAHSLADLRARNGVRELLPLENSRTLARLPNGVYGFEVPWMITSDPSNVGGGTGLDKITLERTGGGTAVMEVHKSIHGEVYIVGFVSQERLVRMQDPSRTNGEEVPLFFAPYLEFNELVAVPVGRIMSSDNRTVEGIYVNDIVFR
jgi:hypothetical protein